MKTILMLSLINMLWTVGLYLASEPDYLLHPLRRRLVDRLGEKLMNPFIDCVYCMPSVHGLLVVGGWHFMSGWPQQWWIVIVEWLVVAVATVPMNFLVYNTIRAMAAIVQSLEEKAEPKCRDPSHIIHIKIFANKKKIKAYVSEEGVERNHEQQPDAGQV